MRVRWLFSTAAVLWLAAATRDGLADWIGTTDLPPLVAETSVEILARDGSLLRAFPVTADRWRLAVSPDAVDRDYIAMLVAYEDKRFYRHAGVDPLALLRAAVQAGLNGGVVSGGSTLTMQVARLLENSGIGRWRGKLRQIRVALALEQRLTKNQILGLYLLHAPFGSNIEGVRAASLAYFGKEPGRLTPAQSALLVALPQSPETRRPDRYPEAARLARQRVLTRLAGDHLLDADRVSAALTEPVPTVRRAVPALAPHLAERVRRDNPLAGQYRLTIDATLQTQLEKLARDAVAARGDRLSVALLVADHRTGEILASVGSAAYAEDQRQGFVDMTRALRSPGSTLKPLVYGLAFDEGLAHPETLIDDAPVAFGSYRPQNFDKTFHGTLRLRQALQLSLNIPVVMLLDALGPAKLIGAIERAGVKPVIQGGQPGLAVGLGGVGISLQDLVQIYAGLAQRGRSVTLTVTTAGPAGEQRMMTAVAAWQVGDILQGMAPPPGAPANRLAYKTGTSYGHRDAWAVGFDGGHVIGVWMGRADGTPVPGAFGGDLAAPILFEAFARLKPALEPLGPPPRAALIVSNAQLPRPLQRFRPRDAVFAGDPDAPVLTFPPDGAEVEALGGVLVAKVRAGMPPFTWLADGVPVALASRERELLLTLSGPGFVTLSVIDAKGRSARASITLH